MIDLKTKTQHQTSTSTFYLTTPTKCKYATTTTKKWRGIVRLKDSCSNGRSAKRQKCSKRLVRLEFCTNSIEFLIINSSIIFVHWKFAQREGTAICLLVDDLWISFKHVCELLLRIAHVVFMKSWLIFAIANSHESALYELSTHLLRSELEERACEHA